MLTAEWISLKIEGKDEIAKRYVNGAFQTSLTVNDLKQGGSQRGKIELRIDPDTLRHFTDLENNQTRLIYLIFKKKKPSNEFSGNKK